MKPVAVAAILFVVMSAAGARAQSPTGSIDGVVLDPAQALMAGVTVSLRNEATGLERTTVTDASGVFRAPLLPVGIYDLTAQRDGFQSLNRANIALGVGQTISLRLEMIVGGVVEHVTVTNGTPMLETSRSQVSSVVDETAIRHLPVNGRNFIDFALLTPGVTRDTTSGDLSFAGQRGMLNSLIVDGADTNNTYFGQSLGRVGSGRAPYQFSEDAVKEFQVNSNAYSAEYGRAGGGIINVVTKSGTNQLAGSAFEYYRDKALNATNAINLLNGQPKSPYHYNQFGGTAGGPLRADRDFFFANYDGQRNTSPNATFLNLPAAPPTDAATAAGVALLQPLAFAWERHLDQDVFFVRTDHRAGNGNISVRYNHENFTGTGLESSGAQVSLEHSGNSLVRTRTINGVWQGAFSPALLNELRVQVARDDESGTANSDNPEANIVQSGVLVLQIGRNNFSPRYTNLARLQVADTVTWMRGSHQFKIGADAQLDHADNFFPQYFSGSYAFRSLASFAGGRPNQPNESYTQNFAGAGTSGPNSSTDISEFSAFAQDSWRLRHDLTVNLGLRYDLMSVRTPAVRNPDPQLAAARIDTSRLEPDVNNAAPRLGIAWNPHGGRYVLRGGWGQFFSRTPGLRLSAAVTGNAINVISLTFTGDAVPTYPQRFTTLPTGGSAPRPNVFYADTDFANPRVTQANAAFEWQAGAGTSVAVTYLFVDASKLPRSIDKNIGSAGSRTFTIAGTNQTVTYPLFGSDRPFTNFARVIALESTAVSRYNGLTIELKQRAVHGFQGRLAYTLGKVVDTFPDASVADGAFPSNPLTPDVDRAVGNNDQRHRIVGSGVYTTRDWSVSTIVTAESGKPHSARVGGFDINNDGNTQNDRAPGTERNAFRLPALLTVDARLARELPLAGRARAELFCEAFNLFNRANINGVVTAYYTVSGTTLTPSTSFRRPSSSAGERIIQLGLRVTF